MTCTFNGALWSVRGWLVVMLVAYLVWERWRYSPTINRLPMVLLLVSAGQPFVLAANHKQGIANPPAASFALSIGCVLYLAANILLFEAGRHCASFCSHSCSFSCHCPCPILSGTP